MTLGKLVKKQGRTQEWLRNSLKIEGIKRNKSHFNEWCNDHCCPKDDYILRIIAKFLEVEVQEVRDCFSKLKN